MVDTAAGHRSTGRAITYAETFARRWTVSVDQVRKRESSRGLTLHSAVDHSVLIQICTDIGRRAVDRCVSRLTHFELKGCRRERAKGGGGLPR
jgi:hypothetical protein